jgi:plastocyanin
MRTGTTAALIALVALATVLATAGTASAATTIAVGDNFFAPSSKTVAAGTKVRFNWTGDNRHNVKKKRGPGGAFKSRTTSANGVNFAKVFSQRGTYRLICTIHPEEMKLKLTVD